MQARSEVMANQNPTWRGDARRDRDDADRGWVGQRSTEHYGGGQSGYGSGRFGDDRAMGPGFRNQRSGRGFDDVAPMSTDDRFTGRGGEGYWDELETRDFAQVDEGYFEDRFRAPERTGYTSGYDIHQQGFGGYGRPGIQPRASSQRAFRGRDDYEQERDPYGDREPRLGGNQGRGSRSADDLRTRGGHRGKGPVGYTRSDARIREAVCETLADDDQIDATHIEVIVKNGEVILTGRVEDRFTKRRAEDVVEHVPGVIEVQNQLRWLGERRGNPNVGGAVGAYEAEPSSKHRA
jgi:hypothetical protein